MPDLVLGLETSGSWMQLCLLEDGVLLGEDRRQHEQRLSVELHPCLANLLSVARKSARDLTAIGVCSGPGSFTSVRIGVTAANALGYALGIPVVGVSSLRGLAQEAHALSDDPVLTLVSAGGQEAFVSGYVKTDTGWSERLAPRLMQVSDLAATVQILGKTCAVAGDPSGPWADALPDARYLVASAVPRARTIAELCRSELFATPDPSHRVLPHYLRPSAAEARLSTPC